MVDLIEDDDDDVDNDSISSSPNDANAHPSTQPVSHGNNRELDNGEHEIIEISEEVVIDDEDNQENDNNYNDISSDSNPLQSREVENEVEKIESRFVISDLESLQRFIINFCRVIKKPVPRVLIDKLFISFLPRVKRQKRDRLLDRRGLIANMRVYKKP